MTAHQGTWRMLIWRGALPALALFTFLMLLGALADRITQ